MGDLESSGDEAGGEDAIARLFSLGGLKRRRSGSESQLESARNDQADAVSGDKCRGGRGVGVGGDAEALLYFHVSCSSVAIPTRDISDGAGSPTCG